MRSSSFGARRATIFDRALGEAVERRRSSFARPGAGRPNQAAQDVDTVALDQALGGGGWNRADTRPPSPDDDFFEYL